MPMRNIHKCPVSRVVIEAADRFGHSTQDVGQIEALINDEEKKFLETIIGNLPELKIGMTFGAHPYEALRDGQLLYLTEQMRSAFEQFLQIDSPQQADHGGIEQPRFGTYSENEAFAIEKDWQLLLSRAQQLREKIMESIVEKGIHLLHDMPVPFEYAENTGIDPDTKLFDAIDVQQRRSELQEIRATGDSESIAAKENEIADAVQNILRLYKFQPNSNFPRTNLKTRETNCIALAIIAAEIFEEIGIKHVVVDFDDGAHTFNMIITSNDEVRVKEMQFRPHASEVLQDDEIINGGDTQSILDFANSHDENGPVLTVKLKGKSIKTQRHIDICKMRVIDSKLASKVMLLNALGCQLNREGKQDAAIEAFLMAQSYGTIDATPQIGMAISYDQLNNMQAATIIFAKSILQNPDKAYPYYGLSVVLQKAGYLTEAIAACKKCIDLGGTACSHKHLENLLSQEHGPSTSDTSATELSRVAA